MISMKPFLFYSHWVDMGLPENHRFPIDKYRVVTLTIKAEGRARCEPGPLATLDEACTVHDRQYVEGILSGNMSIKERKRVGFAEAPVRSYVLRSLASLGATVAAVRHSLSRNTWSGALSGGTHHAFANVGEGFCVFKRCRGCPRNLPKKSSM